MNISPDEKNKHIEWLQNRDIRAFLSSDDIESPWFSAFKFENTERQRTRWFAALVPLTSIPKLVERADGWDIGPSEGGPAIWTSYEDGRKIQQYCPFGNEEGIEPIVIWRSFHGMRPDFLDLSQEFRLYHNLYPDSTRNRFIHIDSNGDESEAARYGENFMEIRTDLLRHFCAAKQMTLAVYVESFRYSRYTLAELGLSEGRTIESKDRHHFSLAVVPAEAWFEKKFETCGLVIGGKKYILPDPNPSDEREAGELYQEFTIGKNSNGKLIRHTCDPKLLANNFGANPSSPHFLTPVYFRPEVLAKYYAEPAKYSVEDGYLRCGGLWGLRMDNDHVDYVVVWLGDLGQDLSERERLYWLSYNIPPDGRGISQTNFKRAFMAEFADPSRPDLAFKHEFTRFNRNFVDVNGWSLFLPLHSDDEHFFVGLHLLSKDNQAEFDSQILALTKVLVDSLNEKRIAQGLIGLVSEDRGITKLEKYFSGRGFSGYELHVKFLRGLQDLRSKSAAHRKGSNYDKLVADLQIEDAGQQRVFTVILESATDFIRYLRENLLPKRGE